MIALWSLAAVAAEPPSPVYEGLVAEIERVPELRLPEQPAAHHALVRAVEGWEIRTQAAFGALHWTRSEPTDVLQVEVRAGVPTFDSTGLKPRRGSSGFGTAGIPDVPTVRAVREVAWRQLDGAYKAAVENLGRKQGVREKLETSELGDAAWQVIDTPVVDVEAPTPAARPLPDDLEALVREVSAVARGRHLEDAGVYLREHVGYGTLVATDGTRAHLPTDGLNLRLFVQARADDDEVRYFDDHVWVTTRDELPDVAALQARMRALAERAEAWAAAPRLQAPWYGPVLVEGHAAADLLRTVVVTALRGTPPTAELLPWNQNVETDDSPLVRPGTRLLPRGWSVGDDATRALGAPCCPRLDAEGIRPVPVSLVEDGEVVRHLMTRTPNRWFAASTGHASPERRDRCQARETWITVTPRLAKSDRGLWRQARKLARQQGVDRVLVIRRESHWGVWRSLDGTETPVRGLASDELDARALRSMTTAGPSSTWTLARGRRYTVPDLLLASVAVAPATPEPKPPNKRASPLSAKGAAEADLTE